MQSVPISRLVADSGSSGSGEFEVLKFMTKSTKDKESAEADRRRDELAKRVLKMPPQPKPAPKKKRPDRSGTPHSVEDRENCRDAE
jgi:hypothetical protein